MPTSGFPYGSAGKESARNSGDLGSIPGLGRSPGEGKGYPLQYSGLENSMDCLVHAVTNSWTQLSDFHLSLTPTSMLIFGSKDALVSQPSIHPCSVSQLCPILCDPMDCSPPDSFIHGIFQARYWKVAISYSRGSS